LIWLDLRASQELSQSLPGDGLSILVFSPRAMVEAAKILNQIMRREALRMADLLEFADLVFGGRFSSIESRLAFFGKGRGVRTLA